MLHSTHVEPSAGCPERDKRALSSRVVASLALLPTSHLQGSARRESTGWPLHNALLFCGAVRRRVLKHLQGALSSMSSFSLPASIVPLPELPPLGRGRSRRRVEVPVNRGLGQPASHASFAPASGGEWCSLSVLAPGSAFCVCRLLVHRYYLGRELDYLRGERGTVLYMVVVV